jgi:Rieske Fe-S protein
MNDAHDVAASAGTTDTEVTRRSALGMLLAAAVGLPWVAGGAGALFNFVGVPSRSFTGATTPDWVVAGLLADLKTDEPKSVMFGEDMVYVFRKGNGAVAFSGVCPHAGCLVAWTPAKKEFVCPCHGGTFNTQGKCTGGPPPRGLDEHTVRISMGRVNIGRKKNA